MPQYLLLIHNGVKALLKFKYSEKASKFEKKNLPLNFDITDYSVISTRIGRFFSNFVAFSEYTNCDNFTPAIYEIFIF